MSDYIGKCPLCSGQLDLNDGFLTCSIVPDHFQVKQVLFESAWEKYEAGKMTFDNLLKILIEGSTAKATPKYLDFVKSLDARMTGNAKPE